MKTHTLHVAVALGLLIYGSRTGMTQQLSLSVPIIIRVADIDRYGVSFWPCAKAMDGAWLGLPYQDMKQAEVDTLVKNGVFLGRPIWIMDGQKNIAQCNLIGEFKEAQNSSNTEPKSGLLLSFNSVEEAKQVGSTLKLEPKLGDLIRNNKSQLNDERFWR
jgi:hypothetical protein